MQVWRLQQNGDSIEAGRFFLDGMQFCCDHASDPGMSTTAHGVQNAMDLLALFVASRRSDDEADWQRPRLDVRKLPPDVRNQLAKGLAELDRQLFVPSNACYETITGVARTLQLALEEGEGSGLTMSWRYGFSEKVMLTAGLRTLLDVARRIDAAPEGWAMRDVLKSCGQTLVESANPLVRIAAPHLTTVLELSLRLRCQLRSMRMALSELEGKPEPLADPFGGGMIQRKEVGGRTYYWSRGSDGVDDSGDESKDLVFVR